MVCAVKVGGLQRVRIPPGNWVAIGAAVEARKPSEPSRQMSRMAVR